MTNAENGKKETYEQKIANQTSAEHAEEERKSPAEKINFCIDKAKEYLGIGAQSKNDNGKSRMVKNIAGAAKFYEEAVVLLAEHAQQIDRETKANIDAELDMLEKILKESLPNIEEDNRAA